MDRNKTRLYIALKYLKKPDWLNLALYMVLVTVVVVVVVEAVEVGQTYLILVTTATWGCAMPVFLTMQCFNDVMYSNS